MKQTNFEMRMKEDEEEIKAFECRIADVNKFAPIKQCDQKCDWC